MDMRKREMGALALIVLGIVVAFSLLLPIRLPILEIAFSVLLIWLGCCLMTGRSLTDLGGEGVFPLREEEGACVRSCWVDQRTIDLTDLELAPQALILRAAAADVTLRLPVDARILMCQQCLFGAVDAPEHGLLIVGQRMIECGSMDENAPCLRVEIRCAAARVHLVMG